jgi:uncharacterized membrane protein (UPF0127 family)
LRKFRRMKWAITRKAHGERRWTQYAALGALSGILLGCQQETPPEWTKLPPELKVELARTPEERERGLKFRKSLPRNEGMYFIFDKEQPLSFYMRDTRIPLSIAFVRSDGTIESVADMIPLDERSVPSSGPAQFVLEVKRSWFQENGIRPGDKVKLEGNRITFWRRAGR